MELSTYFRINTAGAGQFERTLIVADEGSSVSYLEGCTAPMRDENQLHAAVVELIALDDAQHQIFHCAKLVSGRQGGQGRHLQFCDQARQMRRAQFKDFLDAGGNRFGHHLEISQRDVDGRQFGGRILFRRADQSSPAGRHRDQDDSHWQKHFEHHCFQGHFGGQGKNSYRGQVKILKSAAHARNYSQCDSLLLGDRCGAHTFPYVEVRNSTATVEHEASTSKIGEDQIFYCNQRGIATQDAINMIVNGYCKEVFKHLPMEFAVEAQKLLGVSLEGSVG